MEKNEREWRQLQLIKLNQQFLAEVENGAGWKDLKDVLEQMKEIAKGLDHMPANIVSFNSYPSENKLGESAM